MNCLEILIFSIVLAASSAQDPSQTLDAIVGHSAELPCNVTAEVEDDKLNILAWYRNGSSTAFYSRDLRSGEQAPTPASGRYRLITADTEGLVKLQIVTVKPADAGVYHCMADFAASPAHKTFVQLNVIEPPRTMWIVHENGTQVAKASAGVNVSQNIGPYYVGDTVKLFCVAFGGNPQASLSWRQGEQLLKDTFTPLSTHRVRSDLTFGPLRSEDHGRVLSCLANNNEEVPPLAVDIVIDMYLPPELVSLRAEGHEGGRVKAGETLSLQCRVLGARPPPPILWRINDNQLFNLEQNITLEGSQRLVTSDIQLWVSRKLDESTVTCCAPAYSRQQDHYVCADKLPLTVLYPPSLKILVDQDMEGNNTLVVTKGSDITMSCAFEANPAVHDFTWFHGEQIIGDAIESGDRMRAILELSSVTDDDAGEYVCSATNDEGSAYSDPIFINVTYPAYCEDETVAEYGLGENESVNLTCNVKASPEATSYRWVLVDDVINVTTLKDHAHTTVDTSDNVLLYDRPNNTTYSTVLCWGINDVSTETSPHTPCTFLVTDVTMPRPPAQCAAVKNTVRDILVTCSKGHDGGLPQKFKIIVQSVDSEDHYLSITTIEPEFVIPEPKQEDYKLVIIAFNDKGESKPVEIAKDDIVDNSEVRSITADITTLSLALCGGVLVVALAACGLVLCAHERDSRAAPARARADPPLCAYNTDESNCDTYHGSEDDSEFNVRRTESFRRAMARYPSKNFDVRRTSSFHSARYMDPEPEARCTDLIRQNNCRVHSLQNISRKREMDALCDHLVLHLPPETNYNVPKPMNTFYTMPRKTRQKMAREISDEVSEITQTSDGFSLPPPPDEFGTYRAATRIKDMPTKSTPTYTTVKRNNEQKEQARQQYTTMAPINTVGIPTVSGGTQSSIYTYPDDHHGHHQVTTNPFDEDSS